MREPNAPVEGERPQRIARLIFAVGLFLVPIVYDVRTLDVFNLVKLSTLWVLGLVALGVWLCVSYLSGSSRAPARSGIIRVSIVLLVITFVASLLSGERVLSFIGFYHRYEGFVSLVLYVGVLIFIAALYKGRPNDLREMAIAVAAAAGVMAVYVLFQKAGIDFVEWHLRAAGLPPFPIGSLGNSAFTASYLGIALPFVLYLALTSTRFLRAAWVCAGVLIVVAIWFTQGRAGMSAALVGVLAFALYSARVRTSLKIGAIVVALLVLVLAPILAGDIEDPAREGVLRTSTAGYRAELWDVSWRMALDRPVLGTGPETYFGNYPRFRTAEAAKRDGLLIPDSPHSIFLTWATNTGFIGLAAFVFLVGLALVLAGRKSLTATGSDRHLNAAFAAALTAYLGQGVYSLDIPPLALTCWVTLGGLAVLTGDAGPVRPAVRRSAGVGRFVVPAVVGIVVVVLIVLGLRPLRADHAAWAAAKSAAEGGEGWSDDSFAGYEKAVALHRLEPAYHGMVAEYLEKNAADEASPFTTKDALVRAAQLYGQAHDLQPRNIYYMVSLARVNARLGKVVDVDYFPVAQRWIQRVEQIDRIDPRVFDIHINILNQWASELHGKKRREVKRQALLLFQLMSSLR